MNFLLWVAAILGGLLLLYTIVRVASAAFFSSKKDYEQFIPQATRPFDRKGNKS